jgi:hypothetical protein
VDPDSVLPDQAALSNLAASSKRADEARKLIQEFDGPTYFPDDWANAEILYDLAQSQNKVGTVKEVRDSLARYNAAADAYEAMIDKTTDRYAQGLQNEIIGARNEAVSTGAGDILPDYLWDADISSDDVLALYQAKDYYGARDSGMILRDRYKLLTLGSEAYKARESALAAGAGSLTSEYLQHIDNTAMNALAFYESKDYNNAKDSVIMARDMYKILGVGAEAYKVRLEIDDRDFVRFDPTSIAAADAIADSIQADYDAGDIGTVGNKVNDVFARYTRSLGIAKESFARESGVLAVQERQKALDVRANVAVRQDFDTANGIYNQGTASFQGRNFDQSADFYNQSRAMFITVAETAREKRRIAEETLLEAERRVIASEEIAQRAELILEGSMR